MSNGPDQRPMVPLLEHIAPPLWINSKWGLLEGREKLRARYLSRHQCKFNSLNWNPKKKFNIREVTAFIWQKIEKKLHLCMFLKNGNFLKRGYISFYEVVEGFGCPDGCTKKNKCSIWNVTLSPVCRVCAWQYFIPFSTFVEIHQFLTNHTHNAE